MKNLFWIAIAIAILVPSFAQAEVIRYQISWGDTLSEIAQRFGASQKEVVYMNGIKNPDVIFAGDWIGIPTRATKDEPVRSARTAPMSASLACKGFKVQETYTYKNPGANKFRSRIDRALEYAGYPNEVARLIASRHERDDFDHAGFFDEDGRVWHPSTDEEGVREYDVKGMFFGCNTYARSLVIDWRKNFYTDPGTGKKFIPIKIYTAWYEGQRYDIGFPVACDNPTPLEARRAPPPLKVEVPTPVVASLPEPTPEQRREDVVAKWLNRIDFFAGLGEEYPNKGGTTRFHYGRGAFYPLVKDTTKGRHQFGAAAKFTLVEGNTFDRFHFDGSMVAGGPSYKYYDWDGWDLTIEPMVGFLDEHGNTRDEKYRSHRRFSLLGFGFNYNNYKRELAGSKWFPETQFYAGMFWEFDKDAHHQWEGQKIKNKRDLRRFDGFYSLGLRQFIYDWWIRPYVGLEFFGELPQTSSLNPCAGISDKFKIVFAQTCYGINLIGSGKSILWSVSLDAAQAGRVVRTKVRTIQAQRALQYDQNTGSFKLLE